MTPKMGAETFDDIRGSRYRNSDRGSMCLKTDASLDRTGKHGVFNLCLQHEVQATPDTAVVSVCRQTH